MANRLIILMSALMVMLVSSHIALAINFGQPYQVEVDAKGYKIGGNYTLLVGGSVQWQRLPEATWRDRLERFKQAGFNTVDLYIAWNLVEPKPEQFNFTKPNLRGFLDLCQELGLYVIVRPGPYITNEISGGGLPVWLTKNQTKLSYEADGRPHLRSHDPDFMAPVERYFNALAEVIAPYQATHGGPIILYAIENEYTWFERFHRIDKLFRYQGSQERPANQPLPTTPYFTALRDTVRASGIEVPLITCPGDGELSALGNVAGIIPTPSIYEWATPKQPEEVVASLLTAMHNPDNFDGIYQHYPTGGLEINRSPEEFRRLISSGLDLLMGFNMAGIIQEDYNNAVVLAARAFDQPPHWGVPQRDSEGWLSSIFTADHFDRILTGFVAPQVGYFHNVIDYRGAISPSGILTEIFYLFRRDNLFYQSFNQAIASAGHPRISGQFSDGQLGLTVNQPELGVPSSKGLQHYWLEADDGTKFLSFVNRTGSPVTVANEAMRLGEKTWPRFEPWVIPIAKEPGQGHAARVVVDALLAEGIQLGYSTSEVAVRRNLGGLPLLIIYGEPGSRGELQLLSTLDLKLAKVTAGVVEHETSEAGLTIGYPHRHKAYTIGLRQEDEEDLALLVVIASPDEASRTWFIHDEQLGHERMIIGPDYVPPGATWQHLTVHSQKADYMVLEHNNLRPLTWSINKPIPMPELPFVTSGRSKIDRDETTFAYDTSSWQDFAGEPIALDQLGIYQGMAYYRAEVELPEELGRLNQGRLWVEHASDFVGIYINGHYISTVAPLGTEINSRALDSRYRLPDLRPYLISGRNVITFRTEIWGHGSFMFPRGRLILTKGHAPALGYEGLKGLHGKATLAGQPLQSWQVRAGLGGQLEGFSEPDFPDDDWTVDTVPLALKSGDILWYRTEFATADLPDPDQWHAPLALAMSGSNLKATIYFNGNLVGRWLSDDDWLKKGSWVRGMRKMWVSLNPDHFPLPQEFFFLDGRANSIVLALEDTSTLPQEPGKLTSLDLIHVQEDLEFDGQGWQRPEKPTKIWHLQP
jgi:hypothetical protein